MQVEFLDTPEKRLAPRHTALLVIDMQNDFCAPGGYVETVARLDASPCRAVAAPIMELVEDARGTSVPVFWIKANYDHDKLPPGMLARQRQRSTVACCGTGSAGAALYQMSPLADEPVVEKNTYSALWRTELEAMLRARGIRSVALTGVQTNVCVETTLRDAVCVGFYGALVSDCVASHRAALHEATMRNAPTFADILDRRHIAALWRAGRRNET